MEKTFTLDVVFKSRVFDPEKKDFDFKPVKKTATFLELSESDPKQRELTFAIWSLWEGIKSVGKKQKFIIANPNLLSALMDDILDVLLVVKDPKDEKLKDINSLEESEKTELKMDNVAITRLGKWFVENKLTFFFLTQETQYEALLNPQKST
jgi:hypothetical protein